MSQFILIDHIKVQNANAIAGFTWGFPAITHFLGFVHNLSRKLAEEKNYEDIILAGCAVVAHEHKVHTYWSYGDYRFIQNRNPPYLKSHDKTAAPPVIEEGKMNITVSLLVGCQGNIGNRADDFRQWLKRACFLQRLAGGTILDIADISFFSPEESRDVRLIARRLLPGFVLCDRSQYLEEHYQELSNKNPDAELLDAWLDFSSLKQKARPGSDLISKHLKKIGKKEPESQQVAQLLKLWHKHLDSPYERDEIPKELQGYFEQLEKNKTNQTLLNQWQEYCDPSEKTEADWEYVKKPKTGYLVPITTGYKAISKRYLNSEVKNTRDNVTDVCFVESVHSIGEWQSVHHFRKPEQLQDCLWHYHYEKDWYLCKQGVEPQISIHDQTAKHCSDSEETIFS